MHGLNPSSVAALNRFFIFFYVQDKPVTSEQKFCRLPFLVEYWRINPAQGIQQRFSESMRLEDNSGTINRHLRRYKRSDSVTTSMFITFFKPRPSLFERTHISWKQIGKSHVFCDTLYIHIHTNNETIKTICLTFFSFILHTKIKTFFAF